MSSTVRDNVDPSELAKFDSLASRWWDTEGEFRSLHQINPLRLEYIRRRAPLENSRVLDIGCGGGLIAEPMARLGAEVTAIDALDRKRNELSQRLRYCWPRK